MAAGGSSGRRIEPAVDFDHQLHVVALGLADGSDDLLGGGHFRLGHFLPGHAKRVELHRPVAAGDDCAGQFGILGRRPRAAIPAVGIGRQAIASPAAEQVVHGPAVGFADQIPAGDLHAADGREDGRAALILVADHVGGQRLDIVGVGPDDPLRHPVVQQALDGPLLPFQRRLADADEPRVGRQPQEQVVPQSCVGQEGFEAGDAHVSGRRT
jgi:hypothetical protein